MKTNFYAKRNYQLPGRKNNLFLRWRNVLLFCIPVIVSGLANAQTAFTCQNQVSYLTRNASNTASTLPYTLYSTNLITGAQSVVGEVKVDGVNVAVNAIGYNTADNFIWGSEYGTSNILRIGTGGVAQRFAVSGLPAANYTAGDVDEAGNLYLYVPSAGTIYKINVNGSLPLTASAITVTGTNLPDFSVNANGTKIYGVSAGSGDLATYTISGTASTRTLTDIGSAAFSSNTFFDSRNNLFLQSNSTGSVYMLDPTDANIGDQRMVYNGPTITISNGDGAQCRTASVYSNTQLPFSCTPGKGYVVQSSGVSTANACNGGDEDLYIVDLQVGTYSEIFPNMTAGLTNNVMNNLGYNPKDNFLWAYRANSNQLIRIGSDNTIQFFPIDGLPASCASAFNSGDFDKNGIFYLVNGLNPTQLYRVNLDPASPDYLKLLPTLPISGVANLSDVTDMAVNPVDGLLYGVSNSKNLIRINPASGAASNLGGTGIPGTANIVIAFSDITGALYVQASASTSVYRISDVQNGNPTATLFKSGAPSTGNGDGARCALSLVAGVKAGGSIWSDANGDRVKTESNTVTDVSSETLTVYLKDENGTIIGKSDVAANGTWEVDLLPPGQYTAHLSNDATLAVTTNVAIPATLPGTQWVHTGINFGTPGAAGSSSGAVTVGTTPLTNLNFGLNKKPEVTGSTDVAKANPGGSGPTATVPVSSTIFNGSDLEDGTYLNNLTGRTVKLTPGTGGDLYNNGTIVPEVGLSIAEFDPAKVAVDPAGTSNQDTPTVTFTYTVTDNAGAESAPATQNIPFASSVVYTVSGTVFIDPNGSVNGADGTPINGANTAVFANLYNAAGNFVASAQVQNNGTYTLTNVPAGTGYRVQVANAAAINASTFAPNAPLPGTLINVSTSEAPTQSDGVITLNVSGNSTGNNFGIQRPPAAGNGANTMANLGGTTQVAVPGNTFTNGSVSSDADGNVAAIRITSFPTNATSIVINGTSYTSGSWPAGGVTVFTTATGSPVWPISVDPSFEGNASTVTIPFVAIDNAGSPSANTGNAVLSFTVPPVSISGTVFNDVDGNKVIDAGEAGSTVGVTLYAYLVNGSGTVVNASNVDPATGVYNLLAGQNQGYTIELSTVVYPIGSHVNITPINNNLPTGWVKVVDKGNNTPGDPGDGNPDGVLAVTVATTNITNQNFGVADRCSPLASGLPDSDGDGVTDVCDLDDDNDGIPDTDENPCVSLTAVTEAYSNGLLTMLTPSLFGVPAPPAEGQPRSGPVQLIGRNLTADISYLFGYSTPGKVIATLTNANIHPTSDAFYVRGDLAQTKWEITGSIATVVALEHGKQYYFGQRRSFDLQTHGGFPLIQTPASADWTNGVQANEYYVEHLKDYGNNAGYTNDGTLFIGLLDFDKKIFKVHTNDVGLSHWSTYFIRIKPECDTDMDGIPNRLDLDSDGDLCFDAIEGAGEFGIADVDVEGRLTTSVGANGQPAGTPQGAGSSQNAAVQNCFVNISGTIFNDNNGTTDNANGTPVNGTASGSAPLDLIVNLYDAAGNFVTSAPVQSDGTYTLTNVPIGSGYLVQLNTAANVGQTGENISANPNSDITGAFVHVSSSDNVTPTDGITIVDVTANVTGVNFGINEPPTAVATSPASQVNPGGDLSATVPSGSFGGTDLNNGVIEGLTITSFPTGATSITVGATTYYPNAGAIPGGCSDCAVFPAAGISVTTSDAGAPDQVISVDPAATGSTSVLITFTVTDNAGLISPAVSLTVPFEAPMPVTLKSFDARKEGNSAVLEWITETEINAEKFNIEHSINGKNWHVIGTVAAKGESVVSEKYHYTHTNPANGENLYRLKMIDLDQTFSYSRIRSVDFTSAVQATLYPNPASDKLKIKLEGVVAGDVAKVNVFALDGKTVYAADRPTHGEIDVRHLIAGTYVVTVTLRNGTTYNSKIVIVR